MFVALRRPRQRNSEKTLRFGDISRIANDGMFVASRYPVARRLRDEPSRTLEPASQRRVLRCGPRPSEEAMALLVACSWFAVVVWLAA